MFCLHSGITIYIYIYIYIHRKMKNRLLKVCYVPATRAGLPRLLFFFFIMRLLTVLMKQTRQAGHAIKQSIYLDVYGNNSPICLHTLVVYFSRFNYVSKLMYLLFNHDKLSQLPGSAQKILFR
jgi:hypothetical protein